MEIVFFYTTYPLPSSLLLRGPCRFVPFPLTAGDRKRQELKKKKDIRLIQLLGVGETIHHTQFWIADKGPHLRVVEKWRWKEINGSALKCLHRDPTIAWLYETRSVLGLPMALLHNGCLLWGLPELQYYQFSWVLSGTLALAQLICKRLAINNTFTLKATMRRTTLNGVLSALLPEPLDSCGKAEVLVDLDCAYVKPLALRWHQSTVVFVCFLPIISWVKHLPLPFMGPISRANALKMCDGTH